VLLAAGPEGAITPHFATPGRERCRGCFMPAAFYFDREITANNNIALLNNLWLAPIMNHRLGNKFNCTKVNFHIHARDAYKLELKFCAC
jgi:uncharacterized protein (DUF1919 family)